MTLKIEIDVPKGATKVDIGPALEPILARLLRLERKNGYCDLTEESEYSWRNVEAGCRPILTADIEAWLKWSEDQRILDSRIHDLTFETITGYLEREGWTKDDHTREENADWDTSGGYPGFPRRESWTYEFTKTPGWGGSPRPFKSQVRTNVPFPDRYPEARSIFLVRETIAKIRKAKFEDGYCRLSVAEVVTEIENYAHPLVQLARQADQ